MIRFLAPLIVIIQLTFAYHAFKTGREQKWLWIIMFVPVAGCLAYYFLEVFPGSREERKVRESIRDIVKSMNPDGELKRRAEELSATDSVENKSKLADECLNKGMFDEAVTLYLSSLTAQYVNDPKLLLGLARAYFYNGKFADSKTILEKLTRSSPDYHRSDVALLLARAFEGLGNHEQANTLYQALIPKYVGYEAKCRYAEFLQRTGKPAQANELFDEILQLSTRSKGAITGQEEWINRARAGRAVQ